MGISTAIGIGIQFSRGGGQSWESYWASKFTGIPLQYAGNPLIASDAMARCMVQVLGTYHLFQEKSLGTPPYWTINKRTSVDGITFTAISTALMAAGGAGEFDEWGQADPTVIYDGVGDWKMWYDALTTTAWEKLGYATSVDGITWNKVGSVIERGASGWDNKSVHHPCCVKSGSTYYLFYSGASTGDAGIVKHIGLATSTDGINWTKTASNPVISTGAPGQWDDDYIRPSAPIKIFNTWYMWYWGYDGSVHSMGLATSPDLITWTKKGQVLTHASGVTANTAILKEGTNEIDKIIDLWYTEIATNSMRLVTVSLPSLLTVLSGYSASTVVFGDTTPEGAYSAHSANYLYYYKIAVTEAFSPDSIKTYFGAVKGANGNKFKIGVYTDNAGVPGALVGQTEEIDHADLTTLAWNTFDFTTPVSLSVANYWVALWSTAAWYTAKGAGGSANWTNQSLAYGAFPANATPSAAGNFSGVDTYLYKLRPNIYQIVLVTEPTKVYFNTILGNKVASLALVDSERDWFWASNVLYIYSTEHADIRYQITYE